MMFESSLILEMAVLLKVTVFSFGLIFLLAFLTGNLVLLIINLWIVYLCARVCGALGLVAVRSLCVFMPSIWPNMDDIEAAQLFHETALSSFEPHNVESEPMGCSITYGLKDNLVCSSPLEMLNKLTAEIDILDDHEIEATFTTVAEGPKDYYTPVMSPFASPPAHVMEIFVCREETILYENVAPYTPYGTQPPLTLDQDLYHMPSPGLTEIINYCEAATPESNMHMELL
ncbi:hypothetical protein RhiTH_004882 [Rhizoctonia solani]